MENKETVLVTGGTGFVGAHCILQLLEKGYQVKTTLRSMERKNEVLDMLKNGGITSFERLEFIQADLTKDDRWEEAVAGCAYVLHVASPIFLALPRDENEMIRPAVDGALRVLKAAKNAGVRRVVMTSNFGAVGYSHKDPNAWITEADWTDPNEKGLSSYNKSKVMAERAAWDFIHKEGGVLELSVINPVGIFGPSLGPDMSSAFELLRNLLNGSMKAVPNLEMNIIDVRDVADLHIRAMTTPEAKGERFLALAGGKMSMPEIGAFVRKHMPEVTKHMSTRRLPDWVAKLGGVFSPQLKNVASMLKAKRDKVSNEKAKRILHWQPIASNEEAIQATVESMIKFGNLK